MPYYRLTEEIENLNSAILKHLPNRTTGMPISIDGIGFKRMWMHFGLNGSDHDTAKGKEMGDCFLKSIVHLNDGSTKFKKLQNKLREKGYLYDTYFKKPVEFYASQGWYQIWQHPEFFKAYPQYVDRLKEIPDAFEFLNEHLKTAEDKYVVFSDLLFIRERDSKKISTSSILKTMEEHIWRSWVNQIKYYNPVGITIANGQAQDFIRNRLNVAKYSYKIEYENVPVILSSQFSGGALSDPLYGLLRDLFIEVSSKIDVNRS
ncbi:MULTISPECIES: hypothetical protein [unclassified Brevibacillus]|uniref:hypothetical protein n=1 Tax=unclassified Brevibacillus TaxID=2684853 RepID=UPI003565254F